MFHRLGCAFCEGYVCSRERWALCLKCFDIIESLEVAIHFKHCPNVDAIAKLCREERCFTEAQLRHAV